MALALKMDDKGGVAFMEKDGMKLPIYVDDKDGKELPMDVNGLTVKIASLTSENAERRVRAKELEESIAKYGDAKPEDIEAFLSTIEELGGLDGIEELKKKSNVDVESLKSSMQAAYDQKLAGALKPFEERLKASDSKVTEQAQTIYDLMVTSKFSTSDFIKEHLTLPPDLVKAYFGPAFKIEDGKVVAYLNNQKLFSRVNPGEPADVDEALAMLVDAYPGKAHILKAKNASGTGSTGSGGKINLKTLKRNEFQALQPEARMKFIKEGGQVED